MEKTKNPPKGKKKQQQSPLREKHISRSFTQVVIYHVYPCCQRQSINNEVTGFIPGRSCIVRSSLNEENIMNKLSDGWRQNEGLVRDEVGVDTG
jgi:hypothetical protein